MTSQLNAAVAHRPGHWSWAWKKTPTSLQSLWTPGAGNKIDQGALMKFQNDHGLAADGVATPQTWSMLIALATKQHVPRATYAYVEVTKTLPETMKLWQNGKVVVKAPANTGIPAAPTPNGTWPVYAHLRTTTMSGLNPDGTPYHDPNIPFVSYFNGGDALHAFPRGSYGVPQSLGCVELTTDTAGRRSGRRRRSARSSPFTPERAGRGRRARRRGCARARPCGHPRRVRHAGRRQQPRADRRLRAGGACASCWCTARRRRRSWAVSTASCAACPARAS